MPGINVGEGSFPTEIGQCQTGKLARLLRYFTPGNYSATVVEALSCRTMFISSLTSDMSK